MFSLRSCLKFKTGLGFTLIELLIVIAIILILIAIALPNFLAAQLRAKVTNARGCLQAYRTANEAYQSDHFRYAPDVDGSENIPGTNRPWETVMFLPPYGLRCSESEICTYVMLTTPIPYIKDFCYEPFIPQRDVSLRGKDLSLFEYATYEASGGGPRNLREPYVAGIRYGLRYVMISLGPDLAYDYDYTSGWTSLGQRHFFGGSPAYSPTNGTKSRGDLILSNRGHEG